MLGIQHFGYARLGVQQVPGTGAGRGGVRNVIRPPGEAAAMARMNGRCQITSPMPGLT
jgi:hypothetical protein